MDHLPGLAWIKDIEGRYVYGNRKFLQMGHAIGKTDAELWGKKVAAAHVANDREVIRTKRALQTIEPFATDAEGRHIVSKFPIFDREGAVVMVGGASVDISKLRQTQAALGAQLLRYKALMELSTDSIYVFDEKGDLQEANAAFLRRRGYTAAEIPRLNVVDWDARRTREELPERIQELIGSSSVFERRHRCKDGSSFDVEVCATGVQINGKRLIFCVTREITERKQAAAALVVRARQQAVVAQLGTLALMGRDLQELFDQATAMVAETLGVEYCKVLKLLPDGSRLKLVSGVGWKEGLVGQGTVGAGLDSQAGYTLLSKDIVIVDDLRREKRFKGPPLLHEHGVVSGLSVVIGELQNPFGVLGAHTTRHRQFTADDAHFFQSVANLLAAAVQRKRAEEATRESERKYRDLVELTHDLVWSVDAKGRITYLSRASRRIYGREPEEMIGRLFTDFMPPDEARRRMTDLAKMIATEDSLIDHENRVYHRDGHEVILSANAVVVRDEAGNVIGTTGTSRDITQSKGEEEKLRESETRFRQLAENIEEVFWMTDYETSKTIYISPAYERIWGRSCESLYANSRAWREAIHPEDLKRLAAGPGAGVARICDSTYRIIRPDGSIRWIRDREFPVRDEKGRVVRMAGIAQDITASKCAEEERQKVTEQLRVLSRRLFEVRDEERRHLARELHDEVGQALTAAKINLSSLELLKGSDNSRRLNETTKLLDTLLGQVRQISLDLHSSLLDDLGLAPALRSLLDQQTRRAGLRAQFVAAEPLEIIEPGIQTTGFRIAQEAITNVLRHARAGFVSVYLGTEAGQLRMKIIDDGRGFDMVEVERRGARESGFGLMGMRERAGLVGGRVRIVSSPDRGTTVEISLPLNRKVETMSG